MFFITVAVDCHNRNMHLVVDLVVALLVEAFVVRQLDDNLGSLAVMVVDIVPEVALHHNRPAADDNHVVDNHYLAVVVHNLAVAEHHRVVAVCQVVAGIDLVPLVVADLVRDLRWQKQVVLWYWVDLPLAQVVDHRVMVFRWVL